jgi:AraC-like DNA-binding protein/mannose-6-phosphate isomerase-like protein (cupin superfamily)
MEPRQGKSNTYEEEHNVVTNASEIIVKVRFETVEFNILLDKRFFNPYPLGHYNAYHSHPIIEVQYILSGTGIFIADDKEWEICPNSYYLVGSNIYHEQKIRSEEIAYMFSFYIDYKILDTEDPLTLKTEENCIIHCFKTIRFFSKKDIDDHLYLLNEIRKEFQGHLVGYYWRIQSLFRLLLIKMVRDINSCKKADYMIPFGSLDEKRMLIIERFFCTNYHLDVTADQLAKQLHVSIRQLNRILKELFNMTFIQMLNGIRTSMAENYLKNTKMPISEISKLVGYSSISNFYNIFKQHNHCTPLEFRKINR